MHHAPYPARLLVSPSEQMTFNHLSLRHLVNIFLRNKMLILTTVGIITGATLVAQVTVEPRYIARSTTKIEFAAEGARPGPIPVAEKELRMDTQAKLMGAVSLAEMVVRDLKLHNEPRITGVSPLRPEQMTGQRLQDRISLATRNLKAVSEVKRQPRTQLIDVLVSTSDPALSARIADQFPVALQQWENLVRRNDRRNQIAALEAKVKKTASNLGNAEQALADFRRQRAMLVGAGTTMDLAQLNSVAAEAASARANRAAAQARAAGVGSAALGGEAFQTSSPQLAQQQREFDELTRRKAELAVTYGPGYPEMQAVNAQLQSLQGAMASEAARAQQVAAATAAANAARAAGIARSEAAGAAARSAVLSGVIGEMTARAFRNTDANGTLVRLEREAQNYRDLYADTQRALEGIKAGPPASTLSSTALAPATIPTAPVNVDITKNVIVALLGSFLLGFLVAFIKDMLDTRLRSSHEIRRRFALPTLAMVPAVDPQLLADPADNPVLRHPRSLFAENARTLYLEMARTPVAGGGKVVAVTSPLPGDGKSTVALSLAAAAMKQGARSILIDLDLRRSGILQEIQRNSGDPDLIDYINNRDRVKELIPHMSDPLHDGAARLDDTGAREIQLPTILSTHDRIADPGAIVSSAALQDLIRRLRTQFDLVVLNAPPVLAVRDASTLARFANETLMVVRWGQTTTEQLAAAIDALDEAPSGIVFNQVDYAEHARRRHSDAIQFFSGAASYYDEDDATRPQQTGLAARLGLPLPLFGRSPSAA